MSTGLQHTGEAALGAEVAEALLRETYDEAESLLASYVDASVEEGLVSLMLSAVATHEQAERYDAALALLAQATMLVPAHAAELALIAALVEEQMVEQAAGRGTGEHSVSEGAETFPATASRASDASLPREYALRAAYPNPTARGATVPFDLPAAAEVRVVVYDLLGREVVVLAEGLHEAGGHKAAFDASRLASGVYVIRAEIVAPGEAVQAFAQKLTMLK